MEADPPLLSANPDNRPPVHPARGWLLIVLGVFLSGSMAWVATLIYQTIRHNADPGRRSHWNGGPEFTHTVFELFGTVFVFGLVSIAGGVYILRTHRINRVLGAVMIALAFAMAYLGYAIVQFKASR